MDILADIPTQIMLNELISDYFLIIQNYNKRQGEIVYVLERFKNLGALVDASESDVPKELIISWLNETLGELLKMENIYDK